MVKWVIRTARYVADGVTLAFEKGGKWYPKDIKKRGLELAEEHSVEPKSIEIFITFTGSAKTFIDGGPDEDDNHDAEDVREVQGDD